MKKFEKGNYVKCNGFNGYIVREYSEGMYEVEMESGSGMVCVDESSIEKMGYNPRPTSGGEFYDYD